MAASSGSRSAESRRQLHAAVARSHRRTGVALDIGFVRSSDAAAPPLARILRGGRGGEVRLKTYLTLCLLATDEPYDIRAGVPSRAMAEALGLPDPGGKGARRVADALTWLRHAQLLEVTPRRGMPSPLRLLDQAGSGGAFVRPTGRWIRIPLGFWREEWIVHLSGSAVALLLVILEMQGGRTVEDPPWLPGARRPQYGISDDTWTRASAELRDAGLLTIGRIPQGQDFDYRRMRNTYWIDLDRLEKAPDR